MRTPRIFGQDNITVAAESSLSLDSGRFANDGDLPLHLHDVMIKGSPFVGVHIRSTRGIEWMKEPVPSLLLANEFRGVDVPVSIAATLARLRRWRFRYPHILAPHDALDIRLKNYLPETASGAMVFHGYKDSRTPQVPSPVWAPRILSDSVIRSSTRITQYQFDPLKMRNWGDRPMCIHAISLVALPNHEGSAPNQMLPNEVNDLFLKIRLGGNLWMQDDEPMPVAGMRSFWTSQIQIPDIWIKPDDTFYITVQARDHAVVDMRTVMLAIIGSVEV